jgi:hypothetical protein
VDFQVKNSYTIDAIVGSGQTLLFGDINVLRKVKTRTILSAPASTRGSDGTAGYAGNMNNVYLILANTGKEQFIQRLSLAELNRAANGGKAVVFDTQLVDWTKSGLFFADDTDRTNNVGKVIPLTVFYE